MWLRSDGSRVAGLLRGPWLFAFVITSCFVAFHLHDFREPFAYGHARWADAYSYRFARSHLDAGLAVTRGLNVEAFTASGDPIFYLSGPPLKGLVQAAVVWIAGGEFWSIRILPLIGNLLGAAALGAVAGRLMSAQAVPLTAAMALFTPFAVLYGASNEGGQIPAIVVGLLAWLAYLRFVATRRWRLAATAAALWSIGLAFNWLAGFMALALIAHLWSGSLPTAVKRQFTGLVVAGLAFTALILLLQQGQATGQYFYPLRRAVERSGVYPAMRVSWSHLAALQVDRYWTLFGPALVLLQGYWLLRRLAPSPNWTSADSALLALWCPGLVYGFLLRHAAESHDFLLLGFLPGTVLMAGKGFQELWADLAKLRRAGAMGRLAAWFTLALLLGVQAVHVVRFGLDVEAKEARDLAQGAARVAPVLAKLPVNTLVVADRSASIGSKVDSVTGARYVTIAPFVDYLVRRPVRGVDDPAELLALVCSAGADGRRVVLIQMMHRESVPKLALRVPDELVARTVRYDQVLMRDLRVPPDHRC
jgi:hypothetical protein